MARCKHEPLYAVQRTLERQRQSFGLHERGICAVQALHYFPLMVQSSTLHSQPLGFNCHFTYLRRLTELQLLFLFLITGSPCRSTWLNVNIIHIKVSTGGGQFTTERSTQQVPILSATICYRSLSDISDNKVIEMLGNRFSMDRDIWRLNRLKMSSFHWWRLQC